MPNCPTQESKIFFFGFSDEYDTNQHTYPKHQVCDVKETIFTIIHFSSLISSAPDLLGVANHHFSCLN
jgi:hypothetical protein